MLMLIKCPISYSSGCILQKLLFHKISYFTISLMNYKLFNFPGIGMQVIKHNSRLTSSGQRISRHESFTFGMLKEDKF